VLIDLDMHFVCFYFLYLAKQNDMVLAAIVFTGLISVLCFLLFHSG
jgi:hypothetical protein